MRGRRVIAVARARVAFVAVVEHAEDALEVRLCLGIFVRALAVGRLEGGQRRGSDDGRDGRRGATGRGHRVAAFGAKRAHLRRRRDGRAHAHQLHLVQRRTDGCDEVLANHREQVVVVVAAAAAASSPVSLTDAPRARSSEGIGVRAAPPPAFPSAGRSSSSSESHTESSSFLGCDDDVDDGSWPPSPSGVSGTTPGLPPVASSDSNRARSARSWSIVPPRARPCCAERRSGRAAVKFKYPAKMVRPAPAVG